MQFIFILVLLTFFAQNYADALEPISYSIAGQKRQAFLYKPSEKGLFPVVIYNHGIVIDKFGYRRAIQQGYRIDKICQALAKNGYLTFAPIRQSGMGNIMAHKREVMQAIDYVKTLPNADSSRIALMGFSRGALLSLMVGLERNDLKALVILAPAPGEGHLDKTLEQISSLNIPVLLLVEENDSQTILEEFKLLCQALEAHGKDAHSICYNQGGGHKLFWDIGYYWEDIINFLNKKL